MRVRSETRAVSQCLCLNHCVRTEAPQTQSASPLANDLSQALVCVCTFKNSFIGAPYWTEDEIQTARPEGLFCFILFPFAVSKL